MLRSEKTVSYEGDMDHERDYTQPNGEYETERDGCKFYTGNGWSEEFQSGEK